MTLSHPPIHLLQTIKSIYAMKKNMFLMNEMDLNFNKIVCFFSC